MDHKKEIKSYVLRTSRMSKGQKAAIETYSKRYCIEYTKEKMTLSETFKKNLFVEIGFGMGSATAKIAAANPENNYLGIEVHNPGVGRLLSLIAENRLENIKIINHDAVEVLSSMVDDNSVDGFHVFFPDPWPKKKHKKRRLIKPEFSALLTEKLKPQGYIYLVTDWQDYANQMLEVLSATSGLKNKYQRWAESPIFRPETAFEHKGKKKDHIIRELFFEKTNYFSGEQDTIPFSLR